MPNLVSTCSKSARLDRRQSKSTACSAAAPNLPRRDEAATRTERVLLYDHEVI